MNIKKLALEAIEKILYKKAYVNIVINEYFSKFELSKEEKALFTRLVMGTIEKKITLAYYLEPYLKKKQKPWLNSLLLMAVYEIVYMNIENYYVVNEAVEIANIKDRNIGGFVNAVLRNFLRNELREISADDEIKYLSLKYSYPTWLVAYLLKDYTMYDVERIFNAYNTEKKIAIRVNILKSSVEEVQSVLDNEGIKYEINTLVNDCFVCDYPMMNHELFKSGKITIQDVASQKVASVLNPCYDAKVLDMCAAPGSKTSHLAAIMENTGIIYACDIHPHKIKLMKENFKRLGVENVKTELIDARKIKDIVKAESFDYILLDMPCSGLGVMGHKVDLKYNITLDSINEIIKLQEELMESAYPLLKQGGEIVISTCTINKEENQENIKKFTEKHPDMNILFEEGYLPFDYDTDGFYICKLRKGDDINE